MLSEYLYVLQYKIVVVVLATVYIINKRSLFPSFSFEGKNVKEKVMGDEIKRKIKCHMKLPETIFSYSRNSNTNQQQHES
jgi:hypothetical protein